MERRPVPVSILRPGDEEIHSSDHSHRWSHPSDPDQDEVWRERVRAHVEEHRRTVGDGPREAQFSRLAHGRERRGR